MGVTIVLMSSSLGILYILHSDIDNNPKWLQKYSYAPRQQRQKLVLITHKCGGSQQLSRVEYSTQIYLFDTRGAKEYSKVLEVELSIQPHLDNLVSAVKYLVAK